MGFFDKLKTGLNKTKTSFDEKINNVFSNFRKVDEDLLEELEEALIMSDVGAQTSTKIISNLGYLALKEGKPSDAAAYFQTVLEYDPNDKLAAAELLKMDV